MADIVLINPRFDVSYWGMEHALPIFGKRANLPVAALPLLAALTPAEHTVTLIDENVEPINYQRCAEADIVGVTGMIVQRTRMREIVSELKSRGVFTVVGGPWISVKEDYFGGAPDAIFVGEAEDTWPQFLSDWQQGRHRERYEQSEKTDMTKVPVPRFDLLKMQHYLFGSLQFSRGCPFQCEFCDIIVTFGRRPRLKTSAQVIAELESLRKHKIEVVFIVDDNLIGNKKAIKVLLRDLIEYQKQHGYPFEFATEASLDLAEDQELMDLMVDANIDHVFVGVESPNEKSLAETKKFQNVRPAGGTIVERIERIQMSGMEVWAGMILGFDNDDPSIFQAQRRFIQEAGIITTSIGMLTAIPKTPLYDRLAREDRLDPADELEFGTNVIPLRISREELLAGFIETRAHLSSPETYFARLEELYLQKRIPFGKGIRKYWQRHRWHWITRQSYNFACAVVLFWRLMHWIPEASLRREYRRRIWRFIRARPDPNLAMLVLVKCALHYHEYTMSRQMASGTRVFNIF